MATSLCLAGAMRAAVVVALCTTSWSCPGSIDGGDDDRGRRSPTSPTQSSSISGPHRRRLHASGGYRGATHRLQPCPHRDEVIKGWRRTELAVLSAGCAKGRERDGKLWCNPPPAAMSAQGRGHQGMAKD
ncbi:unnamed protein product [Miscanthus lutarioriparius]|uniref:Secreted protein n=1 Tax=Miscanthus lutarioriparius TaxID=422564 RepID=A0A811QL42_9POAL|nr:unnamed protein product [Miscanthus lutarioriparius]